MNFIITVADYKKPNNMLWKLNTKQALIAILLMPVLCCSCVSYNQRMATYYSQLENRQYENAMHTLDKTSFVQRDRNKLLYYFEKGKLYHLMQNYDSSNNYFNQADNFIETERKTIGDDVKSNLINPMMKTYLGEDMEKFMMHYYKGLNYVYLNEVNEAIVEARRISLAENSQQEKFNNKTNRYSKDAFALNLQGMLYEANGDINNAFIAYRNAADVYFESNNIYYGVNLPRQLQQDVLRTAHQMGFDSEKERYEKKFNTVLQNDTADSYLIVFVEKGLAPVKRERNYVVTSNSNGISGFFYGDDFGNQVNIPFQFNDYNGLQNNESLQNFRSFRVAVPTYEARYTNNGPVQIIANSNSFTTETAQDINTLAISILKERMLKEMANAIARQIVKKLAEKAAEKSAESIAKNNSKEKDEKKKADNAKNAKEITGLLVNIINMATEKADTRNWQSLPAFIQYARIPLEKGVNVIEINGKKINVTSNGRLQFLNETAW